MLSLQMFCDRLLLQYSLNAVHRKQKRFDTLNAKQFACVAKAVSFLMFWNPLEMLAAF